MQRQSTKRIYALPQFLLRTGTPAAHPKIHLMLLCPQPDMVHGIELRRTHPSSQKAYDTDRTAACLKHAFAPAVADCRFRAPLSPRLAWPDFVSQLLKAEFQLFCFGNYTIAFIIKQLDFEYPGSFQNQKQRRDMPGKLLILICFSGNPFS